MTTKRSAMLPQKRSPSTDWPRLKTTLQRYMVGLTDPPVPHIKVEAVEVPDKPDTGYVLTLIPETEQKAVRAEYVDRRYYIRVGASFVEPPPALLRHLFYPQRSAKLAFEPVQIIKEGYVAVEGRGNGWLTRNLGVFVRNDGPATAIQVMGRIYADPRCK